MDKLNNAIIKLHDPDFNEHSIRHAAKTILTALDEKNLGEIFLAIDGMREAASRLALRQRLINREMLEKRKQAERQHLAAVYIDELKKYLGE